VNPPLKLSAVDQEDLQVIAALLQDALVPVGDMRFLADEKRFVMVVSRFRWENCKDSPDAALDPGLVDCSAYERVHCGLAFGGVARVRQRGIDPKDTGRILELLHLDTEPGAVTLLFAGEAWPTPWRPSHPTGEAA
jgi:Protein of unknown function (DUF2948)